jgi:hypothetical protein
MEREIRNRLLIETFGSIQEFADTAVEGYEPLYTTMDSKTLEMVAHGWSEHAPMALDIAESAVTSSVDLCEASAFAPVWDVTGAEVDVARYLSGEPECMIDFPLQATVKAGKVITLVSSADSNWGSDWLSRGILATALGLALARLGYATEMWADNYGISSSGRTQYQRILIKSTADEIDPARMMFAFGHKNMLTQLAFGCFDGYRNMGPAYAPWYRSYGQGTRGSAEVRTAELEALYPEGTIFLTGQLTNATPESAKAAVEQELRNLGLLAD